MSERDELAKHETRQRRRRRVPAASPASDARSAGAVVVVRQSHEDLRRRLHGDQGRHVLSSTTSRTRWSSSPFSARRDAESPPILRLIAGLPPQHPATSGTVLVSGKPVLGPGADRGMVFQDYTSFDNRTVEDNVAFGLECRGVPAKRAARAGARVDRQGRARRRPRRGASTRTSSPAECASAWRSRGRSSWTRDHPDGRAVRRARSADAAQHAGHAGVAVA